MKLMTLLLGIFLGVVVLVVGVVVYFIINIEHFQLFN